MKFVRPRLTVPIAFALTLAAGCAATPADRWFQQRAALTAANRVYLAHVPAMTDDEVIHYGEMLQVARVTLARAREHIAEGGEEYDALLDVVESILAHVAALEAAGTQSTGPVTEDADR